MSTPTPAPLSEGCLPAPFSVLRGGWVATHSRCGLFSRMATALAEHFACARCGSACLIAREHASERSLFLREEAQEQVPVHHCSCATDDSSCSSRTAPSVTAVPLAPCAPSPAPGISRVPLFVVLLTHCG